MSPAARPPCVLEAAAAHMSVKICVVSLDSLIFSNLVPASQRSRVSAGRYDVPVVSFGRLMERGAQASAGIDHLDPVEAVADSLRADPAVVRCWWRACVGCGEDAMGSLGERARRG